MSEPIREDTIPIPFASPDGVPEGLAIDPSLFLNRELSWLDFNERVLEEARDPSVPLLERLRFLAITASNLDEFYEVRVAGLQAQLYEHLEPQDPPPDGMSALAQVVEIGRRVRDFVSRQHETWQSDLLPKLAEQGIVVVPPEALAGGENEFLDRYFESEVYPVLTPLAIDPAHPFPHLHNKSLNLILRLERLDRERPEAQPPRQLYAVLQVPGVLSRLVRLPAAEGDPTHRFILLEDVIGPRLDSLFGGFRVVGYAPFRVTRNSDLSIQESDVKSSLLSIIQENLRKRMWGDAVRMEISDRADEAFVSLLQTAPALDLEDRDVYRVSGPVALSALASLCKIEGYRELKEPPWEPQLPRVLAAGPSIFEEIREQDILVHHPFESFDAVVQLIEQAAVDPQVLAIKQTLYRTAEDNPIIDALARAAGNGKQVTVLVEIQARLDEENNISKARMLQKAGVHVVYGMVGLKTHCKAALVVRRESDGIRRYIHLGTGNYNPTTARLYTDLGLFTCRPEFGDDASALFNLLTGYSQGHDWQKLMVAPFHLVDRVLEMIDRERRHAEQGRPARIIAKMNALVDPRTIAALYAASRAGVQVDLIVRGICCLRPGVPGHSENIRVLSIIDKFLEHSRITYFQNGDAPQLYLSSADWMPRNFNRRVELLFPVEDPRLHARVVRDILGVYLVDNVKSRLLHPDGSFERLSPGPDSPPIRAQTALQEQAVRRELPPAVQSALTEIGLPDGFG
ncbi:polyphosphate kinase 1 [Tautonia plasticadhaerens]|uniref:Polyphosphate kinase n=1 Tax=Tautonia plasticadhaerens TaxID=2527974 RepID=A0A518H722_9BACT|nr:polyphosphate kinase 1 [Tautonia plasticadhaerens]QDV36680.1 Polyphosphate kinase [Tautonia plasticadhaerens]